MSMANQQPAKQIWEFGNFLWVCSVCSSAFVAADRPQPCTLDVTGFSTLGFILLFFVSFFPFSSFFKEDGQGMHQTTLRQTSWVSIFRWLRKEQDSPKGRSRGAHMQGKRHC